MAVERHPVGRSTVRPVVAWALCALLVIVGGPVLVVGELRSDRPLEAALSVSLLVLPVCGALVLNQRPGNPLGWLFLVSGASQVFGAAVEEGRLQALGPGPGSAWLAWAADETWPLGLPLLLAFGALLFPDGSPTRRWRILVPVGMVGMAAALLGTALSPWSQADHAGLANPLAEGDASPVTLLAFAAGQALVLITATGGVLAGIARYRQGGRLVRAQQRLVLVVLASAVAVVAAVHALDLVVRIPESVDEATPALVVVGFPVSVTVALFRHRLFDLDLLVNRMAIALVATVLLSSGYAVVVVGLSWSLSSRFGWLPGSLSALVIASAFHPVLQRTRAALGGRLFGEDEDGSRLLAEFTEQTGRSTNVASLVAELAEVVRQAVRSPHVAVRLSDGIAAAAGRPCRLPTDTIRLDSRGVDLGEIVVTTRSATDRYSAQERSLLSALARQGSTAIHLARSSEELRRSHERATAIALAERERLRRDLHDELGPRLAGVTYLLHALGSSIPANDRPLLDQVHAELQSAMGDVRRMTHDLRPSVLEELGLIQAIRRHANLLAAGSPLQVSVEATNVSVLPQQVETALYRVALEALSNVDRHAKARTCVVRVRVDDDVASVEIIDDGRGIGDLDRRGIGLASMGLRAAELGGHCEITGNPGTTVRVRVPIRA